MGQAVGNCLAQFVSGFGRGDGEVFIAFDQWLIGQEGDGRVGFGPGGGAGGGLVVEESGRCQEANAVADGGDDVGEAGSAGEPLEEAEIGGGFLPARAAGDDDGLVDVGVGVDVVGEALQAGVEGDDFFGAADGVEGEAGGGE